MNEFMIIVISLCAMVLSVATLEAQPANSLYHSMVGENRKPLFGPVRNSLTKRSKFDDVKYFEGISESSPTTGSTKGVALAKRKNQRKDIDSSSGDDNNYDEIKALLTKLLDKIGNIQKSPKRNAAKSQAVHNSVTDFSGDDVTETAREGVSYNNMNKKRKVKDRFRKDKKQRWGKWTNWSPCSVSCGKGREIRWRHCLENCEVAETEMEEKTCQLPACGPSKLFGVIKL